MLSYGPGYCGIWVQDYGTKYQFQISSLPFAASETLLHFNQSDCRDLRLIVITGCITVRPNLSGRLRHLYVVEINWCWEPRACFVVFCFTHRLRYCDITPLSCCSLKSHFLFTFNNLRFILWHFSRDLRLYIFKLSFQKAPKM